MSSEPTDYLELPEGWYSADPDAAKNLVAELQREMPPGHLLFGHAVEAIAFRQDQDDVLFRHLHDPNRFIIIHLTWSRKREIDSKHPSVCFDGTFKGFIAKEQKVHELE
jgi:hypothetical protein